MPRPATPDDPNPAPVTPPARDTTIVPWNELHNLPGEDGKLHPYRAIRLGGTARFPAGGIAPPEGAEEPGDGTWNNGDADGDGAFDAGFVMIGEIDYRVMLRYAEFNPVPVSGTDGHSADPLSPELEPWRVGEPLLPEGLSAGDVPAYDVDGDGVADATGYNGGGCHLYLVQLWTQPLSEYCLNMHALGATILKYIAENVYLVQMSRASATAVRNQPGVRWIGACHPAYKVHEDVISECLARGSDPNPPPRRFDIYVPAPSAARKAALGRRITEAGGQLNECSPRGVVVSATMSAAALVRAIQSDEVGYVGFWGPAEDDMVNARTVGGASALALPAYGGFTGEGVRGEVMDSRFDPMHVEWTVPGPPPVSRVIRHGMEEGSIFNLPHGNATYGIVFGDGSVRPTATGMLPGAGHGSDTEGGGIFASWNRLMQFGGSVYRFDHTAELVGYQTEINYRAVFQSNSWGTTPEVLEYGMRSAEIDDMVWRMDLLICNSIANSGANIGRQEAWAKNVVAVGGVHHNNTASLTDDVWPAFVGYDIPRSADNTCGSSHYPPPCSLSQCVACCTTCDPGLGCCTIFGSSIAPNFGPAPDGRFKPDFCHFYDNIECTIGEHFGDTDPHTGYFRGTSGATPIVAGHFGLFFQMWHEKVFPGFGGAATVFDSRPHSTTARAMLINTAHQYSFGSPNLMTRERQGWGIPDLLALYNQRHSMLIVNETTDLVGVFSQASFQVQSSPPLPLKVTMVYADPEGVPMSSVNRINDLTLSVTSPSGVTYYGNSGLDAGPWTTSPGSGDKINVVENVYIESPQAGIWTITVKVFDLGEDGNPETPDTGPASWDADFALVVTGLPSGALATPADWNNDGEVTDSDVVAFLNSFFDERADIDGNGKTDSADFFLFVQTFFAI